MVVGLVKRGVLRRARARWGTALVLVGGAVTLAAGCGGGGSESAATTAGGESGGGTTTIVGSEANDHGVIDVTGMDEVSLELDNFYFDPTVLAGSPGQTLTIDLENGSGTLHNFSLDAQTIDQDVEADGTATVTVTFPDSGVVRFYCKYHEPQGMVGGLTAGSAGGGMGGQTTATTATTSGGGYG